MSYVFNIGLNRAGTSSLNDALNYLGISSLHHRFKGERLTTIIKKNQEKGQRLFYGLENFTAFTDFSGWDYYKTLDEQYPNSKFIMTYRDLYSWLDSRERHVKTHGGIVNRARWEKQYKEKIPEIFNYFRNRKDFLIINIPEGEGWAKLCPFLGKPIPQVPFFHKNKSL